MRLSRWISRTARALAVLALMFGAALLTRGARAADPVVPSVLVFSGSDGSAAGEQSDAAVTQSLRSQGYSVQLGPTPDQWDGTQADLFEYDAVLLLNSYNSYFMLYEPMPLSGQMALEEFVASGGGLITGEWVCQQATWLYNDEVDPVVPLYEVLGPMLPADGDLIPGEGPGAGRYVQVARNAVVDDGLPVAFNFDRSSAGDGVEGAIYAKEGATVFFESAAVYGDGLVGWDYYDGRVASFSVPITAASIESADFARLLSNSVRWSMSDVAVTAFELDAAHLSGGDTTTGRIRLSSLAYGDVTVKLKSDDPQAMVPASVTIPEGEYGTTFTLTAGPVSAPRDARITVTYGGVPRSTTLTLLPYAVDSLTLTPPAVAGGGGRVVTAKVRLTHPAAPGDITVALSSSNPAVASVPAVVVIPAGTDGSDGSGDVTINTSAVSTDTAVTLAAGTAGGTKTAILTVQPVPVAGISFNPATFPGGTPASQVTGLATIGVDAIDGGTSVALSSNNPAVAQPVDAGGSHINSVTVAKGKRQATFFVKSSAVTSTTAVTFLASAGEVTKSATVTVKPVGIASFALSTAGLSGGKGLQGSVKLDAPAGPGDLAVTLAASDPTLVTVPGILTIPAGKDGSEGSGTFTITTIPVETAQTVTVTATLGTASASAAVTLQPPATPGSLKVTVGPSSLKTFLTWADTSDNETGFRLLRKVNDGTFELLTQVGAGVTSYNDTSVTGTETRYYYRVQSYVEASGRTYLSGLSNTGLGIPLAAPTNLAATRPTTTSIKLTWTDNSALEGSYAVERKTGTGAYAQITQNVAAAAGTGAAVSYTDTTVEAAKTYTYRIRAFLTSADGATGGSSAYVEQTGGPLASARIKLTPSRVEFGKVKRGGERAARIKVKNLDHHPVKLRLGGPGSPFTVVGGGTFTLRGGASRELTVRFRPKKAGSWKRKLDVNCPDGTCVSAQLSGKAGR
jgi:hypothetical protein